jgi:CHAT domain-containing protein
LATAYSDRIRGERADNLEEAIRHYELALEVRTRAAFPEQWAGTQNNLANAYSDRIRGERADNLEAAIRHYELALEVRTREQLPQDRVQTARNLGDLHFEQKNWSAAHRAYELARDAAEDLFRVSITGRGQQAEMEQLADLYDRDLAVCAELYKTDTSVAREALEESEAARSRAFLRQLGLGDFAPPASIPAPLVAQEKNILAQQRDIENNLAGVETRSDRMSEMERALTERRKQLLDEVERVWDEMLAASPDAADYVSLRRAETPKWNDLFALAARVKSNTALVEFHLLDDQTLAFVWRAGWDAPKMLSLSLTRERLLHRYLLPYEREVLNIYRRSQAQASGRELYHDWLGLGEELLAPLVERRSDGTSLLGDASLVYFIPHQFLHLLPLHALTVNGEPFIARRAVAYAPSAAVLGRVLTTDDRRQTTLHSSGQAPDGRQALVMGYTEYPWQRDVFNGEAVEVAKLFGAEEIVDEHATRAALAERAPAAPLIHLSCHGAFDGNDSLNSAVALADGPFTARDWMRLALRAELVTLSACQLAFNRLNPGDDLVGMTRALMYAGASSVLLALWSVYADTTQEWMLDFYNRIRANGDAQAKAYAFRDATLALRAKYLKLTKHDDPYIWAPFVLVGDWM